MTRKSCSLTSREILDTYFLENRARLLEIASFLDRLDRAADAGEGRGDYRQRAFIKAVQRLLGEEGGRTKAIQLLFSDPSSEPIESALGLKATGAWGGDDAGY